MMRPSKTYFHSFQLLLSALMRSSERFFPDKNEPLSLSLSLSLSQATMANGMESNKRLQRLSRLQIPGWHWQFGGDALVFKITLSLFLSRGPMVVVIPLDSDQSACGYWSTDGSAFYKTVQQFVSPFFRAFISIKMVPGQIQESGSRNLSENAFQATAVDRVHFGLSAPEWQSLSALVTKRGLK